MEKAFNFINNINYRLKTLSSRLFLHKIRLGFLAGIIIIGILLESYSPVQARTFSAIDKQAIDAYLKKQVTANRIPGLSVAIVQGDQIIFQEGYGTSGHGKPMTAQSQLYIGSLTKSFTALSIMQLVDQGKLELDSPIQHYLPWFQLADSNASSQITIRHLLNQTSGLSEVGDPYPSTYAATLEDQIRSMNNIRPTAPVGSTFQYYNQNYRILGLLIEQASGESYSNYLKAHVFAPLGMAHSITDPSDALNLSQGYSQFFGFPLPRPQSFHPAALPSGYIITSAEDMAHYMIAQLNQGNYKNISLVSQDALKQMQSPPVGIESTYGMGWMVVKDNTFGNVIYHTGDLENFHSEIFLLPDLNLGFVVLFNQGGVLRTLTANPVITSGLADLLVGKQPKSISYFWIGWVLLLLAAGDLFNHRRRFLKLDKWLDKIIRQVRSKQWSITLAGVLMSLLMFLAPPLVTGRIGDALSVWKDMFGLAPDLSGWLAAGLFINLARSILKLVLVAKQKKHSIVG